MFLISILQHDLFGPEKSQIPPQGSNVADCDRDYDSYLRWPKCKNAVVSRY